jgi:hypothetical protein
VTPDLAELAPLLKTDGKVIYFPVRHHSPAAARILGDLIRRVRPKAVLIEGPSDFNDQFEELYLPHALPIAIYTYVNCGGVRRGAFYPFCLYSPEWQAILAGREVGATVRFIDLPWAQMTSGAAAHRYADGELRRSGYIENLCQRLGVEDFDALWDLLFEVDGQLDLAAYLQRCHTLCYLMRYTDGKISGADLRREAFMAQQIQPFLGTEPIVIVTGGFHSHALYERLQLPLEPFEVDPTEINHGIALTPYSYERLDSLTGYEAGMPGPGFYHQAWEEGQTGNIVPRILSAVAQDLRERKQMVSSADLIAVSTTAKALAVLRGHPRVWRRDLVDGITASLVKEELNANLNHPFLNAVHTVLRGTLKGKLAEGTRLPPLVENIHQLLADNGLELPQREKFIDLDLRGEEDRHRSRILHQLQVLKIAGFTRTSGVDLLARDNLEELSETWRLCWTPKFEASAIEQALYGRTLKEAAHAQLLEIVNKLERDASAAAQYLLCACWMGFTDLSDTLLDRLQALLRSDADFFAVTIALGHLLYLYRYDEVLGTVGQGDLGNLVVEVFDRSLWLLESLGRIKDRNTQLLDCIKILLETFERCRSSLSLNLQNFIDILGRILTDPSQTAVLCGASLGVLWTIASTCEEVVISALNAHAAPSEIGDFLTGLFALGREVIQRYPQLLETLNRLISQLDEQAFLEALPALRLAFTFFTPHEKHHLALNLFGDTEALTPLVISPEITAKMMILEEQVFALLERFSLRGGRKP